MNDDKELIKAIVCLDITLYLTKHEILTILFS